TGFEAALRTALLILSGLLPGIASIMNEYSERLALSAQARQYDRMRIVFERASELLPEAIDARTARLAQEIYLELGREAMRENAEWTAIYRQRPIQPPRGSGNVSPWSGSRPAPGGRAAGSAPPRANPVRRAALLSGAAGAVVCRLTDGCRRTSSAARRSSAPALPVCGPQLSPTRRYQE